MARIEVKSEITGTVWQLKAQPGDKVESGDVLIVIESMKMEITVLAPRDGVVHEVLCAEGQPVTAGQPLVLLSACAPTPATE